MTKDMADVTAAIETHLNRANKLILKHMDNVSRAVLVIHASQKVVRVEGIELNLTELQEEVIDIAEVIDSLKQDSLDILQVHVDFAELMQIKIENLINLH